MRDTVELSDRYEIQREIGAGGMARVFLGHDHKHDRPVAVKVLRPELSSGLGKVRFLQEIRFAARLSHPNILPLFDSGEADGHLFFVMPYVEGPSLRLRLVREGRIPLDAAAELARNVAVALDYAHRHDIVHRDIKPENVMIHDGVAVVTDFGVGKALSQAAGQNFTQAGVPIGTPAYMSPEQLAGDPNLDGRADIYSLGCVLFEMLTGEQPYQRETPEAAMSARFTTPPPDATEVDAAIPTYVAETIKRALSADRADRFATGADFAAALAGATTGPRRASGSGDPRPSEASIAVLPFANMSADPENDYFSDGITEEIINALAQLKHLRVSARTSSFAFKGRDVDVAEVGSKLNVRTVLEGSVRRAGPRVRITAQLINVDDGYHVWSERYDREMVDVFEVQDEIAGAIADQLQVIMTRPDGVPMVKRSTEDIEAYNLYLRGRFLWNRRTKDGLESALDYFERAIQRDPKYADPYAGLADVYLLLGSYFYLPRDEAQTKAKEAATRALALDDSLAEAHTSLGQVLRWELDWEGEERHYLQALRLNPGYATAHHWYSGLLHILGRTEEALQSVQRAAELDPLSHAIIGTLGLALEANGRLDEAEEQFLRALELEPAHVSALASLAHLYAQQNRVDETMAMVERLESIRPNHPLREPHLAFINVMVGRPDEARRILAGLDESIDPGLVGLVYAHLGEYDRAFTLMNEAIDRRAYTVLFWIKTEPAFDGMRDDPRYRNVVSRLKLPLD